MKKRFSPIHFMLSELLFHFHRKGWFFVQTKFLSKYFHYKSKQFCSLYQIDSNFPIGRFDFHLANTSQYLNPEKTKKSFKHFPSFVYHFGLHYVGLHYHFCVKAGKLFLLLGNIWIYEIYQHWALNLMLRYSFDYII